ncbi:helix-turn-helix domain-containing protein [Paenibacillus alvei]|uniref:Helix-turn-helix domain-containing protein n=1 Tax=Paenibacillus alvei TaxID=44250 RepID=A0ABT4GY20_PAEAL|nr:helix-turn-helix transcriptional regulator [Paenibacillus alvei]MCY9539431.1 helix-turn-helix domain-containing protein [Paenibacillus alvei]MCY9703877.1 helix-turn-helix domain-containing protein [Paenibacillus alvei]MCY9733876.1 helix-turn-helix domain-containing protein [Paenibacillus alvei]MCY9755154.1 helix-turn-helix domain-containing protein [Paenibacillus alvei]MCY9761610.1 helix-turn-helix domain-containing protein [Paenibacillus alvei]
MVSIVERIDALMKAKKISRYQLAKDTDIPYTTLTNILIGRTKDPQISTLQVIADYFGVPLDRITGNKHQEDHPEWANQKDKRDFKKMLEDDASLMFDGVPIEGEDREKVMRVLEALFWDAKHRSKEKFTNKRYKEKSDDTKK